MITGLVRGSVSFLEHPDHVGHLGLQGGEDVHASRASFRCVGEAMTWCRRIIDGAAHPRTVHAHGDLLTPRTDPVWTEAVVTWADGAAEEQWQTEAGSVREWRELKADGRYGRTVRVD